MATRPSSSAAWTALSALCTEQRHDGGRNGEQVVGVWVLRQQSQLVPAV